MSKDIDKTDMNKVNKIIMLPTEDEKARLVINSINDRFLIDVGQIIPINAKPQHLYIISDEPIKEGDSVITLQDMSLVKVIATTDPNITKVDEISGDNVWTSPIPQIPQSLVEYYAKHKPEEVELVCYCEVVGVPNIWSLTLINNEVVWVQPRKVE